MKLDRHPDCRFRGAANLPSAIAIATAALLLTWVCPQFTSASESDPGEITLYETESARSPSRLLETPQAISVISREEIHQVRPAVTIDEAVDLVPGVFAQGGRNFAQDSRVSIRGYGARATFGVRGIRLLVDGVPNTLADGQSEVDSLDLAFTERIEISRGPMSALYGGSGGGTISVQTLSPSEVPRYEARVLFGSDHLSRYSATTTGTLAETGYAFGLAWTRAGGYRDHSRSRQQVLFSKLERELAGGTRLQGIFSSTWAPEAQDPGGLKSLQVESDRSQARADAITGDSREKLNQQKLSLSARHAFGESRELRAMIYGLQRDFSNALPNFVDKRIDLDRSAGGLGLLWIDRSSPVRFTFGLDLDIQKDQRSEYGNDNGLRGSLRVRQSETVRSVGPFGMAEFDLDCGLGFVAGVRYDWTEFKVGDRFVNGGSGDHSDRRRFRQLSPRFGIHFGRSPAFNTYANLSSSFRVPTTTELAEADGGFSSNLDSESTLGFEIGAKGVLSERLYYDLAVFDLRIKDVAVGYTDASNSDLFRDAGEVRRRGAELGLSLLLTPVLSLRLGYTYADYRYKDFDFLDLNTPAFVEYDGNREPNTPQHSLSSELRYDPGEGPFAVLSLRHYADIETNDENSAESPGATLLDLGLGWRLKRDRTTWIPFLGVRNLSKVEYDQTLRPNDFNSRFHEPAPETELYIGLELSLD
ncbi:MAG: TonB-dependent receptor [bacterium]|nr:TonB-dependent receptor [bacterium]